MNAPDLTQRPGAGVIGVLLLAIMFVFSAFHALAQAADRVALVIGNSTYDFVEPLANPGNDAAAISARLQSMEFDVQTVTDATLDEMRQSLDAFGARAEGAEVALVFYAGHGMQLQGRNYLVPTDARLTDSASVGGASVAVAEIFEQFNRAAPETAILILDACRDNPFVSAVGTSQGLTSGSASAQNFVQRPNSAGMLIAFAAAPGAVALDGVDGNSPYTTALLQWMDRPGLELATMFRRVRGTVLELTNGAQVPWVEEALVRDVVLTPGAPALSDEERIEVALLDRIGRFENGAERRAGQTFVDRYRMDASFAPVSVEDEAFAQQGLIWLSIRQSEDPEVFEAFLEQFPGSAFSALAENRIQELQATPAPKVIAWLDDLDPVPPRPGALVPYGVIEQPTDTIGQVSTPDAVTRPGDLSVLAQADGTIDGLPTASKLPPPTPAELEAELGLSREEMMAVQVLLREAGVYRGAADADYGPGTRGGIRALQELADLPVTGFLDVATLRQIVGRAATPVLRSDIPDARRAGIRRVAAIAARGPGAEPHILKVAAISRNATVHDYWREIADDFEAENPDTVIEIDHRPGVRYRKELMSILGAERPPDILYTWSGRHLDALREAGFARDLTETMSDGWAMEFKPGALQTYTDDGRIHGVPMHLALVSLYVNRPVLDRAGIAPESLATWPGFLDAVRALKAQGITPLAVGGGDRWPFHLYYGSLAQRLGGRAAFDTALAGAGDGFQAAPFVAAGDAFAELAALDPFQDGFLEMDDGQAVEMLSRGEVAMVLTGNWRLQKMRWSWPGGLDGMARELLQLPFPAIGDAIADAAQNRLTHGGADGFAVTTAAPDIAVDFVRRLTARDVQERMAEIASDVPSLSGANLALEGPFLPEAAELLLDSPYHQLYLDQELGPGAGDVLTDTMVLVGSGQMSGSTAAATIDAAWDLVLEGRVAPIAAE